MAANVTLVPAGPVWSGTAAEKAAVVPPSSEHALYYETDTGLWYIWTGAWTAFTGPSAGPGGGGTLAQMVQGNVAHDAVDAGNPVKVGGKAISPTAAVAVATGDRVDAGYDTYGRALAATSGVNGTAATDNATTVALPIQAGQQDLNATRPLITAGYRFNGTGWDRARNNIEATLLASAARTATGTSADQTNYNGKGIALILNVTVEGAATLTVTIQGKDPISGNYYDIITGIVLYTAASDAPPITRAIFLMPGLITADFIGVASGNGATGKAVAIPRTWRATVTPADATTTTYSLAAVTFGE